MHLIFKLTIPVFTALLITTAIFVFSLPPKTVEIGSIENTQGIPYPIKEESTHIYEPLAHADIYLNQPVLAKKLLATITFVPINTTSLSIGIRENPFWLSYSWENLYNGPASLRPVTKTIALPLTDKLQEKDASLDLMFLAKNTDTADPESTVSSTIQWELRSLTVQSAWDKPTGGELKDWLRSIIRRERAL
jgi:hypothetical protein